MGQKNAKHVFENDSPEAKCLELLRSGDWEGGAWYEIFANSCASRKNSSEISIVLQPNEAAKFLTRLFKHLRLPGNSRQFVASMMARLDVKQKGHLVWSDVLGLRGNSEPEKSTGTKQEAVKVQSEDLTSRIVKFSEVYANYRQNLELIHSLVDKLALGQKRQDGGLKEAFFAVFDTLSALYELDIPKWNAIKARTYISFVKKTDTTNTSVTSGIAASILSPGETVGILNCGTGPLKFQFYKMDEARIVRILVDFTPPEEQGLYINGVLDESKRDALSGGIATTLGYLLEKRPARMVAIVTGELREAWAKGDDTEKKALETTLHNFFHRIGVEPWSLLLGEPPCYFLPQVREGKFEDVACGNLIADLAPQHDVLISCGIGRGTCQWSNRLSIIGHGFGMNAPEKLIGSEISLKKTVLEAFTPAHLDELENLSLDMGLPVIALKSGCLLVLERIPNLMRLLTRSDKKSLVFFPAIAQGHTIVCDLDGELLQAKMAVSSTSGECLISHNGKQSRVFLESFMLAVPDTVYTQPTYSDQLHKVVARLRQVHRKEQLEASHFALLKQPLHKKRMESDHITQVLCDGRVVGTAACADHSYVDDKRRWAKAKEDDEISLELAPDTLVAFSAALSSFEVTLALSGSSVQVEVEVTDWFACFPVDCTLSFTTQTGTPVTFMATVESLTSEGFYTWRFDDFGSPPQIEGVDAEGRFVWPTASCKLTARHCVVYRYKPDAALLVLDEKEGWVEAAPVRCLGGNWHELQIRRSRLVNLELNASNHTWNAFHSKKAFDRHFANYQTFVSEQYNLVEDAITGRKLRTDAQLISLQMRQLNEGAALTDVRSLVKHLGTENNPHVLILATAGSGKTVTSRQLMLFTHQEHVHTIAPILIVVQRLANYIRKSPQRGRQLCGQNFIEFYLRQEFVKPTQRDFLLQAVRMRQVAIIVDGIDEAADCRNELLQWILVQLKDHRAVITSRPEGILPNQLDDFKNCNYTLLDLDVLTPQQQRRIIELQLQDNAYYKNLLAFSAIRTAQDELYHLMHSGDRQQVEQIKALDKLKKNPNMRQRNLRGKFIGGHSGLPVSDTLRSPNTALLQQLSQKVKMPEQELWKRVVETTDELYQVAELAQDAIKRWIEELCTTYGVRAESLEFSKRLKDPVRVYEKALDDYAGVFTDDVPPTACVVDIVRCRLLDDLKSMAAFVNGLVTDPPPGLTIVRLKNKCNPRTLDAAHVRNFLLNIMVRICTKCGQLVEQSCCGEITAHIFEIQVHHAQIVKLGEDMHQHHYYEALRSMLREDAMQKQVDFVLDEQMTLFDRVGRVPVLLSMLVLVLGDNRSLPTCVFELFRIAIKTSIRSFATRALSGSSDSWVVAVYELLQRVAYETQSLKMAVITQEDLDRMHLPAESLRLWDQICGIGEANKGNNLTFSVIKVISQKELYRFAHLSLQEFLYLDYLKARDDPPNFELLLDDEKFDNVLRIGVSAPEVAPWLVGDITLRLNDVNARQLTLLVELVVTGPAAVVIQFGRSITIKSSDMGVDLESFQSTMQGSSADPEFLKTLARTECQLVVLKEVNSVPTLGCLIHSVTTMLDLTNLKITDEGVALLVSCAPLLRRLEWLDLGRNSITSKGVSAIATALRENYQVKFIGLSQNAFDMEGVNSFVAMLNVNHTLTKWHLSSTKIQIQQIEAALRIPTTYFSGSWIRMLQNNADEGKAMEVNSHQNLLERYKLVQEPKEFKAATHVYVYGTHQDVANFIRRLSNLLPQTSRVQHRDNVRWFLLRCVHHLVAVMPHYGPPNFSVALTTLCKQLQGAKVLDTKSAELISRWWKYACVQKIYFASQEGCFYFPAVSYLLNDAQFIAQDGYVPTIKDLATVNISEYYFTRKDQPYHCVFGNDTPPVIPSQKKGRVILVGSKDEENFFKDL